MKSSEESKNDSAIRIIVDILTGEKFSEKTRLAVLKGFKRTFNKGVTTLETKFINGCDIESFIDALSLADSEGNVSDDDFHKEYFNFLLMGLDNPELHEKIRLELVRMLRRRQICHSLVVDLWNVLEKKNLVWTDIINEVLPCSRLYIEETALDWMTKLIETNSKPEELNIKYYAELSVDSCDIFYMLTSIFNEFVIVTEGNEKVLGFVHYFMSLVFQMCDERGKEIFKLYPRNVCHIVSFLSIPPRIFSGKSGSKDYRKKVLKLLLNAFKNDKKNVLLLLTHYPDWMAEFVAYVEDNG